MEKGSRIEMTITNQKVSYKMKKQIMGRIMVPTEISF